MFIYSVAVDPRHQGKGYATALPKHAEVVARTRGCQAVSLYTNRRMTRNVALHRRIGYAVVGERPHPSREGEILLDMTKHLSRSVGPTTAVHTMTVQAFRLGRTHNEQSRLWRMALGQYAPAQGALFFLIRKR